MEMFDEDHVGRETLEAISIATRFNSWMYSSIRQYCTGLVLEIGSGIGNISQCIIDDGHDAVLTDYSMRYVEHLSRRFAGLHNLRGVCYFDVAQQHLERDEPEHVDRYDTVVILNVMEHIRDDVNVVRNIKSVLKPGGTAIILVPAFQSLYCDLDRELGHYRRYSRSQLAGVVEKGGLQVSTEYAFNSLGVLGWLYSGKFRQKHQISTSSMSVFEKVVWVAKLLDAATLKKVGLSRIVVAINDE
ncbi:class I SAM-dependent methyltransferase [bacterium]|nr:class I SAM-dependent methyltransferase [bacterium]